VAQVPLPLLETTSKIFNENATKGHQQFLLNLCNISKMPPFYENPWQPLATFPLEILDNVCSSGSSTGIAACSHRGNALKGTEVSNLYDYFK
jgi:hypothetical protein